MPNKYATTAGTKIYYGDVSGGEPATQLAGIDGVDGMPELEVDEFETTRLDQEEGTGGDHDWHKQWAPDHIDDGELSLKLGMDETQLETLYGLVRVAKKFMIRFSSGGKLIFPGYLKTLGPQAQAGDEILISVVFRVTGKAAFTKAPS